MKVSELGEFGLIDLLSGIVYQAQDKETAAWQELILGMGDDAAAWRGDTSIQLATLDSLVQGVHFTLETTSWEELGWKAMAVNLSDIAAMGGLPCYALVSLSLPGNTEVEDVTALYRGMIKLGQQFEVAIIGGNMSSSPLVSIDIVVLGSTGSEEYILTRSAAKVGEEIAVTGYLGASAAGLEMLTKNLSFTAEAAAGLKKAFLQPYPRIVEGRMLVEHGVRSAIDISDGLLSDLRHICQASKVGARVEINRVPVQPAVKDNFGDRALELALSGGEDYELLFTASSEVIDRVRKAVSCPVTVIGEVTGKAGEITLVDGKGNPVDLPETGWEHFTGK
ncbi:MAG: thiamine-phosphate kinase [Dehalococcoidales bacterium]|nr:thiamine-phosphate kinase [Dehalococcoidales bacterium]